MASQHDLVDIIIAQDLVFIGSVEHTAAVLRHPRQVCGDGAPDPTPTLDVTLQVESVLLGVADDSTIVLSLYPGYPYSSEELPAGARVLAWARRICDDDWRLWGGLGIVNGSDLVYVQNRMWNPQIRNMDSSSPFALSGIQSEINARRAGSGSDAYDGAEAIALLVLDTYLGSEVRQEGLERTVEYTYSFSGWLAGDSVLIQGASQLSPSSSTSGGSNQVIEMLLAPFCHPFIGPGDTLAVPVAVKEVGDRVRVRGCPYGWKVIEQYIRSLGVPKRFVGYAVRPGTDRRLRLKPVIAR